MVEFAFAVPILALVFLMIIDVGLVVREHQVLQNAAREGARYSAQPENRAGAAGATLDMVRQRVVDYCAQEGITVNLTDVRVNQSYTYPVAGGSTNATGSEVEVTYTTGMLLLGVPLIPTNLIELSGRSVFRNLY